MRYTDELRDLSLEALIESIRRKPPGANDVTGNDLWYLLQLMKSAFTSADAATVAEFWPIFLQTYGATLITAADSGTTSRREVALERVAIHVSVICAVPSARELIPVVVEMVLAALPMSLERTRFLTKDWRSQPRDTMRELRYAKNLLSRIKALRSEGLYLPASTDAISPWLDTWPDLP